MKLAPRRLVPVNEHVNWLRGVRRDAILLPEERLRPRGEALGLLLLEGRVRATAPGGHAAEVGRHGEAGAGQLQEGLLVVVVRARQLCRASARILRANDGGDRVLGVSRSVRAPDLLHMIHHVDRHAAVATELEEKRANTLQRDERAQHGVPVDGHRVCGHVARPLARLCCVRRRPLPALATRRGDLDQTHGLVRAPSDLLHPEMVAERAEALGALLRPGPAPGRPRGEVVLRNGAAGHLLDAHDAEVVTHLLGCLEGLAAMARRVQGHAHVVPAHAHVHVADQHVLELDVGRGRRDGDGGRRRGDLHGWQRHRPPAIRFQLGAHRHPVHGDGDRPRPLLGQTPHRELHARWHHHVGGEDRRKRQRDASGQGDRFGRLEFHHPRWVGGLIGGRGLRLLLELGRLCGVGRGRLLHVHRWGLRHRLLRGRHGVRQQVLRRALGHGRSLLRGHRGALRPGLRRALGHGRGL
mmetsp:Transcript_79535/g.215263  ORF Transcript_79535/g.215263 Transcript_79535/m.215263 type:complete len:468 (-) Transcript_79535:114-1517(-)